MEDWGGESDGKNPEGFSHGAVWGMNSNSIWLNGIRVVLMFIVEDWVLTNYCLLIRLCYESGCDVMP